MKIAYRRVSSTDQNLDRQLDGIEADRVFEEAESGARRSRPQLETMIEFAREGDTVLVHSLDRLGRDVRDLLNIVEQLNAKGVSVEFVTERLRFSSGDKDPLARLQLHMLSAFAQFERSMIRKRQAEGIAKAKARGVYKGRPSTIDVAQVRSLKEQGLGATEIARRLNITRSSVYRLLQA